MQNDFRVNAVDRAILVAALGWTIALTLLALAESPTANLAIPGPNTHTTTVAPPVGFVQIAIPAHGNAVVATPFKPTDSTLDVVLAEQMTPSADLATADRVLVWDSHRSRYSMAAKLTLPGANALYSQWVALETDHSGIETIAGQVGDAFRITPGIGFVLCNRQNREQTVRLGGEVVLESLDSLPVAEGLNLMSYPFTSAKDVNKTPWSKSFSLFSTNAFRMGVGYWVTAQQSGLWTEPRPYPNPFSTNAPVRISNLLLNDDTATLDIHITDTSMKSFNIFVRDLLATDCVTNLAAGWRLAATVDTSGKTEISWSDDLAASASSFKGVRLYLVTSATEHVAADEDITVSQKEKIKTLPRISVGPNTSGATSSGAEQVAGGRDVGNGLSSNTNTSGGVAGLSKTDCRRNIVYVDIRNGDDVTLSGFAPTRNQSVVADGSKNGNSSKPRTVVLAEGPYRTIRKGIETIGGDEGTLVIQPGSYREHLNVSGRSIHVEINGKVDLSGPCTVSQVQEQCQSNGLSGVMDGTVTNSYR